MPDDKVVFQSNGEYNFGTPLQEMDVKRTQRAGGTAPGDDPPSATKPASGAPKAKGPKKFDMSRLRQNAGTTSKTSKTSEPVTEATKEEKPASTTTPKARKIPTPKPRAKTPTKKTEEQPAAVQEMKLEETSIQQAPAIPAQQPEPAPTPKLAEDGIPTADAAPVQEPTEEARESVEFKLQQLGLSNRPLEGAEPPAGVEEEKSPVSDLTLTPTQKREAAEKSMVTQASLQPVEPVKEPAPVSPMTQQTVKEPPEASEVGRAVPPAVRKEVPVPAVSSEEPVPVPAPTPVKKMDLSSIKSPKTSKPAESAPASKEEVPASTPNNEVPETAKTAPPFIFNTLEQFLGVTQLSPQDLGKFSKKVAQASSRGVALCQSKQHELLRAYSCVVPQGRSVPKAARYLVTLGWDVNITTCYVDQDFTVSDGSSNLECSGICANVQGVPVALSMERKRPAVQV